MPFGLKNAAQAFQRMMDRVCHDLSFVFVYLDDILIASGDEEEHARHLNLLFDRLEQHGLVVKPSKCIFGGVSQIDCLGHHVTADGISPLPGKVEVVRNFPRPSTVKSLQEFIGMVNFYHWFIRAASRIMRPLFGAVSGKPKDEVSWTEAMLESFHQTKDALANAVLLSHLMEGAGMALTVDASDTALGGVRQ